MMVNAAVNSLGKKVLLVDMQKLSSTEGNAVAELFQEAELSDAVLFFDECEAVFSQRGTMLNTLLTSIERFHGLVFLATNKPLDIDEAMHRRISRVYMFRPPNCQQRLLLWDSFRGAGLQFCKDIDWNTISMKYELTGGFIKNAVMNALMMACSRDVENPVINQEDLVQGCSTQMRGFLQMKASDFAGSVIPKKGLNSLVIEQGVRRTVEDLVSFEKTRSVLFASWRFDETIPEAAGSCVLVSGPLGCGKRTLIEAIAHELGKTLMQFDASVLSKDKMDVVFRHGLPSSRCFSPALTASTGMRNFRTRSSLSIRSRRTMPRTLKRSPAWHLLSNVSPACACLFSKQISVRLCCCNAPSGSC